MNTSRYKLKTRFLNAMRKSFAMFTLCMTLLTHPTMVSAAGPVVVLESLPDIRTDFRAFINEGLRTAAAVGFKNGVRAFLEKLAFDAAVTLTSGCEYQGPCVNYKNVDVAINEAGDAALGEFLNTLSTQNGFINLNLCDLPEYEKLQITLLVPKLTGKQPYQPTCTFSQLRQEVGDYSNDLQLLAATIIDDPTSLGTLSIGTMKGENAMSSLLAVIDEQTEAESEAARQEAILQIRSDFRAIESPISGYIKTPASVLEIQTNAQYAQAAVAEYQSTGHPIADALSVFTNTLAKRLLDQTTSGLLSFVAQPDINDTINATSRTAINSTTGGGVQLARERFATLQTPAFATGGQVDVLNEFTTCPETGVGANNCVIGQGFRRAIEEQMTLGQAMDRVNGPLISRQTGFLYNADRTPIEDFEIGLNERSIAILQSHGVIPSTWMLAAKYNMEYDGTSLTLGQLVDDFDDPNSPYFGLVDPDWVLKAPEVFCKVQGYGQTLVYDDYVDTDGNPDTPEQNVVSRVSSCVDEQTCLSEDNNGNCEAYGYCTKYDDRYRLSGQECPEYYASCESFSNSDGENFSVLTNTTNSGDCSDGTVGCQWLCGVYNTVDEAFQCASQDTVYETCNQDNGCACVADDATTCTIADGGFFCTTDTGVECTVGVENEGSTDIAITFDDDVTECDDGDVGCTEFIPVSDGANLAMNYSFESFNDAQVLSDEEIATLGSSVDDAATLPYDDTFGFYGAEGDGVDAALAGEACSAATDPQTCFGWELDGTPARAVGDSISGSVAMQLESNGGGEALMRLDTGYPLENRTFTLSFSHMNPTGDSCTGEYWVAPNEQSGEYAVDIDYDGGASTYETEFAEALTFPDGTNETVIELGFASPSGCDVVLDSVVLVEAEGSPGTLAYGDETSLTYVNTEIANECSPDEVGCSAFTPESGESDFVVTGQITNPLSEACGDGEDYTDPSCSQCVEEFVGCDAHIELPTPYNSPINDITNFDVPPSDELAAAIAQRTGNYCDGTTTACNTDDDCDSGVQCLPSISIVPDQAQSCSAEAVGCEEYTNLNEVDQGGEGTVYYTYTRQCVQPTQAQIDDETIGFYYSFESTEAGYQLRSHYLKVSDDGSGAPCTNLDNYDLTGTAESAEADCVDSLVGSEECDPADNPECLEYYDADLNTYYRLQSEVIEVSEECISARNSLDNRVYTILPEGSTECSASQNLCREYQGSQGGSARAIIEEDFETAVWDGGTSSAESLSVDTGLSMLIDANTASVDVSGNIEQGQNYVIQFWARGDGAELDVHFTSGAGEIPFTDAVPTIDNEWQVYILGPVVLENTLQGNETLEFTYEGTELYVDNVVLSESESQYLLSDTLVTCNGYEGCEEYSDQTGEQHFLKSFTSLCEDDAVGCQALLDTHQDADNPFYTVYNDDNEFTDDDTPVSTHNVVTYAVTDDALCDAEFAGCTDFGEPSLDAYEQVTEPTGYAPRTLINDPDTYTESLCQEQQRWCDAWTGSNDNTITYAKNFGQRYCEYDASSGEWVTSEGEACPLQNENASPSQPSGSVCNGGARTGEYCSSDSDCPALEGDTNIYRCVSYANDSVGWAGLCSDGYNECTLYTDPATDSEVKNNGFEFDNFDNSDYTNAQSDGLADYWETINEGDAGTADAATTGASYESSDVTNMVASRTPESNISIWHESDFSSLGNNTSGTIQASGGAFNDADGGNPSSAEGTLVGTTSWNGLTSDVTVRVGTDNSADPSVSFTIPALSVNVLNDQFMMFHIADDGRLYWADSGHDGVKQNKSDYLTPEEAITSEHLVSVYDGSAEPLEVNGFYDAQDLSSTVRCDYVNISGDSFAGAASLEISAINESCMIATSYGISVDPNKTYTLRAKVKMQDSDNRFAVGLLYYDAEGNEINAGGDPLNYAIAAYEGEGRNDEELPENGRWLDYHGEIGPNLTHSFPEDTASVVVFVEGGDSDSTYFDDVIFSENGEYTYIQSTVDTTSCNGQIDQANGCVPLRDTTDDSLTFLSAATDLDEAGAEYSVTSCAFDSPITSAACYARAFAADTNRVVLVDLDRECSQWLACRNQENVFDDDGNVQSTVCSDLGLCTERNIETGACTEWADEKDRSDLVDADALSTDLNVNSQLALTDVQQLSGYAEVGGSWNDGVCTLTGNQTVLGQCTSGLVGRECVRDSDCDPVIEGNYPYNWMPYVGLGAAVSSEPIISNGDFEAVYCDGDSDGGEYSTDYSQAGVERQRNKELRCTVDRQCRTLSANATIETYEAAQNNGGNDIIDEIRYEGGWCGNVENNQWNEEGNEWSTENADMTIIDYSDSQRTRTYDQDTGINYEPLTEGIATGVAAARLDLDNYLFISPTTGAASYAVVEIAPGRMVDGQEYTVQFDAAFTDSPSSSDNIEVLLVHGDGDGEDTNTLIGESDDVQFTQTVDTYTFGPITASKSEPAETSYLYIGLNENHDGTPFVLDDVQINASLALNGNNSEYTGEEELVGRECRAYPQESSLECSYTDDETDVVHRGWNGFCTVHDPFDRSKCITWFPVDVIPGEPSFSSADLLFWTGHFPVYHCVAAKGNATLGTCSDSPLEDGGIMCLSDSDCGESGAVCLGGDTADTVTLDNRQDVNVSSSNYETTISFDSIPIDRDPHVGGRNSGLDNESASFIRVSADKVDVLKNIHISEIENLTFDIGTPDYAGTAPNGTTPESSYFEGGEITFDLEEILGESDGGYNMFKAGEATATAVPVQDPNSPDDLTIAYQKGVWCDETAGDEEGICSSREDAQNHIDDLGFYYVKGVTGGGAAGNLMTGAGGVYNDGDPLNPFVAFNQLDPNGNRGMWDRDGIIETTIAGSDPRVNPNGASVRVEHDPVYFFSRFQDSTYSCMGRNRIGCGMNMVAFYADFEDGYISNMYFIYWDALHRLDAAEFTDASVNIKLREVCLAAVETVDTSANTTPWWERASDASEYIVDDLGFGYRTDTDENMPSVFGRMAMSDPLDDGLTDNVQQGDFSGLTVISEASSSSSQGNYNNLPYVYADTMVPFACIGSCANLVCEGDRATAFPNSCSRATGNGWIGVGGFCSNDGTRCTEDSQCGDTADTCIRGLSGDGVGSTYGTYLDQLDATVDVGWSRLRLVFADLSPSRNFWFADAKPEGTRYEPELRELNDFDRYDEYFQEIQSSLTSASLAEETILDFCTLEICNAFSNNGEFDFDAMDECSGARGSSEYCGIRPTIENFTVNGVEGGDIEANDGQLVNVRFETNTDDEQEPVATVLVDWEADPDGGFNDDGEVVPNIRETADGVMSYSHVYTCDPTQGDVLVGEDEDANHPYAHCRYNVRVQVRDNWGFCSGTEETATIRGDNCTSFDEYDGNIIVRP